MYSRLAKTQPRGPIGGPVFAQTRFDVAVSAEARRRLVGGDGIEPPTLSV
jgi:hypothetical protein